MHSRAQDNNYHLLIASGTKTHKSEGLYVFDADLDRGVFAQKSAAEDVVNPNYVGFSPDKKFVYAVSQTGNTGTVSAFAFTVSSGAFSFLNRVDARGSGPCYVSVTKRHVITADYSGGSVSVFGRKPDGSLTETLQVIQHSGSSINLKRQKGPHVHQTVFTPDGKYLAVTDLGTDQVTMYRYQPDATDKILIPHSSFAVKPGSGPRHLTFSRDGKRAYLLQEIDGTLTVLDVKKGRLHLMQETTVAVKSGIENGAADIHLSPDGKFLYASNRGTANDITCFMVKKDGTLVFIQQVATGGIGPRNFAITPDGRYLLAANQRSGNIAIFRRDKKTGLLTDSGKRLDAGAPVCLLFF